MHRGMQQFLAVVAAIILAVFATITWFGVGTDPVSISDQASGVRSVTWAANVSADGRLAISIRYQYSDSKQHQVDVRVPDGARYLTVNGSPVAADNGVYATELTSDHAAVSYELPGAVTRYRDGSLLRLAKVSDGSLDGDGGLFPCVGCYVEGLGYGNVPVYGTIAAPGVQASQLEFVGLSSIRSAADHGTIRFVGIAHSTDAVSMLATLPADATPGLPTRDGTVGQALDTASIDIASTGSSTTMPSVPSPGSVWLPLILTIMLVAVMGWLVLSIKGPPKVEGQ
ncbi:MAG: hypothetical protein JWM34_1849 [Ilumatobacteraceae bacterium]|nr:hypothetical protein [Ilumatobacteraceae bacterium]